MEAQRENRPDFWLLQYQKLMDQQPAELSLQTAAIDPLLGFQFLNHGVVHCLPFLSKIWQDSQTELQDISNDQLLAAGVQNDTDRYNILRSIEIYLQAIQGEEAVPVDDQTQDTATAPCDEMEQQQVVAGQMMSSECVICMDAEVSNDMSDEKGVKVQPLLYSRLKFSSSPVAISAAVSIVRQRWKTVQCVAASSNAESKLFKLESWIFN